MKALTVLGRVLYSALFITAGFGHFSTATIGYAASQGVPLANIAVPFAGILAILGGLSILLGFHARIGGLLLVLFLVPVTLSMHAFWSVTDPMQHQIQQIMFMKNLSLLGSAIFFSIYGSGAYSLDRRQEAA